MKNKIPLIMIVFALLLSPLITIEDSTKDLWNDKFTPSSSELTYEINVDKVDDLLYGTQTYSYDTILVENDILIFSGSGVLSTDDLRIDLNTGLLENSNIESMVLKDTSEFQLSASVSYSFKDSPNRIYKIVEMLYTNSVWKNGSNNVLVNIPVWVLEFSNSDCQYDYVDQLYISVDIGTLIYRNYTQTMKSTQIIEEYALYKLLNFQGIELYDDNYNFNDVSTIVVQDSPGFEILPFVFGLVFAIFIERKKHVP